MKNMIIRNAVESIEAPTKGGGTAASQAASDKPSDKVVEDNSTLLKLNKIKGVRSSVIVKFIARAEADAGEIAKVARSSNLQRVNLKDLENGTFTPLGTARVLATAGLLGTKERAKERVEMQSAYSALKDAFKKCGFIHEVGN